jgi:hypothetical protein
MWTLVCSIQLEGLCFTGCYLVVSKVKISLLEAMEAHRVAKG